MPQLHIRFTLSLEDYSDPSAFRKHGPLFHRWLPDGEPDAIELPAGNPRYLLKVWFERRGFVQDGWIEFDAGRREVDQNLVNQQAALDAGPLRGSLLIDNAPAAALAAIVSDSKGSDDYMGFARHIVQDVIQPRVSYFIDLLRLRFGQHWIQPLDVWDSRRRSLGSYCHSLNMRWSTSPQGPWQAFLPEDPLVFAHMVIQVGHHYRDLITRDDWLALPDELAHPRPFTLAERILGRAHAVRDASDLRFALVEATTALEIAIDENLRERFRGSDILAAESASLNNLPLAARFLALIPRASEQIAQLEHAVEAIDRRHEVIHEGAPAPPDTDRLVNSLLSATADLLPRSDYRFPRPTSGNTLASPSSWQQTYAASGFPALSQDSQAPNNSLEPTRTAGESGD